MTDGPEQGAALAKCPPNRARTTVTFHLPFDSGLELWREPPSVLSAELTHPKHHRYGVVVQQYAAELRDNLLRRLPHEVWGAAVDRPAAAGALEKELAASGVTWKFGQARVSIWNGGAGLLVLTYEITTPAGRSWAELDSVIDDASVKVRVSPVWVAAVGATADRAEDALMAGGGRVSRLGPLNISCPTFSWCHRSVNIELDDWDELVARAIADTFVWNGLACDLGVEAPASVLRFALTACHVTVRATPGLAGEDLEGVSNALERLVSAHTTVWQTLQTCDLRLQEIAAEWRTHRQQRAGEQVKRMDDLLGLYEAMLGYTATLRDVDVHLSSLDERLWQSLSNKWGLERRLDGIDERLRMVRDIYATAAASAGARRADRFTSFAWVFTLLGAVSTCLALIGFVSPDQGTQARLLSAAATVCGVAFVWLGFWSWQRGTFGDNHASRFRPGR